MATTFLNDFLYEFVTLLVILDPIATIPMYLAVTQGLGRRQSLAVAFYAVGIAFLILLFFIFAGQFLLTALKIPMASFQLAGSIMMLLISLKMALGTLLEETAAMPAEATALKRAIFPLATPEIAGAGAILTVVMLVDNDTPSFAEQAATTGVLALCMVLIFVSYAIGGTLMRLLGRPGIEIVVRVAGLILASIAVTNIVIALKISFGLP